MTVNIFPTSDLAVVANEGCYYWGWYTAAEMQLFLIIPILFWFFEYFIGRRTKAQKLCGQISCLFFILMGSLISFFILYDNNMCAGLFAP